MDKELVSGDKAVKMALGVLSPTGIKIRANRLLEEKLIYVTQ
jgi:hypothetical protein